MYKTMTKIMIMDGRRILEKDKRSCFALFLSNLHVIIISNKHKENADVTSKVGK